MPSPSALRIAAPGLDFHRDTFAVADQQLDRYKLDPFALIDDGHVRIFDLELKREIPFVLYDHQRSMIADFVQVLGDPDPFPVFYNIFVEKSRQMGDTWALAYVAGWAVSYWPIAGFVTHLKQKKVDDGGVGSTPDSFFGKIRFMWSRLPPEHQARLDFSHLLIRNLLNGGRIVGEGASSDPGRGGTYHFEMIDEAARLSYGRSAQAALVSACRQGRAYVSTPFGEDEVFHEIKKVRPRSFRFHRHHWSQHPVYGKGAHIAGDAPDCARCKQTNAGVRWDAREIRSHRYPGKLTSPWYDEANAELGDDETVAQELDIDYAASLTARVYPEFDETVHVTDLAYDPKLNVELCWDYGADTNAIGVFQDAPRELRMIGEYEIGDALPEDIAGSVRELLADLGVPLKFLEPHWTRRILSVGDPAGEARQQATGRPLIADYRRAGFSIVSQRRPLILTIRAVKRLLVGRPKRLLIDRTRCPNTIEHFKKNRWPTDAHGRRRLNATEPLNDSHNHMLRAVAYYATYKYPPPETAGADHGPSPVPMRSGRLSDNPVRYGDRF